MLFVAGRDRRLPAVALAALLFHVGVAWAAVEALELDGAAVALSVSTLVVLGALLLLLSPEVLVDASRGLAFGVILVGALALAAFGAAAALLPPVAAAAVGVAAFGVLLAAARSLGLRQAWGYLRTLE